MIKPDANLSKIVGDEPLSHKELISKVSAYVRENNLRE